MENPIHTVIDLSECIQPLDSAHYISKYIRKICAKLQLIPCSDLNIVKFEGGGEGITAFQCLSTSSITLHTYPESCCIYIDIFACSDYSPFDAFDFTKEFFGSLSGDFRLVKRMLKPRDDFVVNVNDFVND